MIEARFVLLKRRQRAATIPRSHTLCTTLSVTQKAKANVVEASCSKTECSAVPEEERISVLSQSRFEIGDRVCDVDTGTTQLSTLLKLSAHMFQRCPRIQCRDGWPCELCRETGKSCDDGEDSRPVSYDSFFSKFLIMTVICSIAVQTIIHQESISTS